MLFRNTQISSEMKYLVTEYENFHENTELTKRLSKTLYFGRKSELQRPSLAMTEFAVDMLQDIAPKELGRIDIDWVADMSGELVVPPNAFLVGMIYAKRLQKKQSKYIHQISSSDLFLVSMMVASKFLYDEGEEDAVVNSEWATSVNMDVKDLNDLECNFLAALDWNLFVSEKEFWTTLLLLEQQLTRRKLQECRSLTYTELLVLTTSDVIQQPICQLLVELCKVVAVCTTAYAVSSLLLVASQLAVYGTVISVMGVRSHQHLDLCAIQPACTYDTVEPLPLSHAHGAVCASSFANDASKFVETNDFSRKLLCTEDADYVSYYLHMVLSTVTGVFCLKPRQCPKAKMDIHSRVDASMTLDNSTLWLSSLLGPTMYSASTCTFLSPVKVVSSWTPRTLMLQNFTKYVVIL